MIDTTAAVLCYVEGAWAYFTTKPLSEQWGDDWDDAPYEHNAGTPYEPCWHNEPAHLYETHRGNLKPGEICQKPCCADGWNPDGTPKFQIIVVAWDAELVTPDYGQTNSRYSVEQINAGEVAWLRPCRHSSRTPRVVIQAGVTLQRFIELINEADGTVYLPAKGRA